VLGPERVAAVLVVVLFGIGVPVALGVSSGRVAFPSSAPPTVAPSVPPTSSLPAVTTPPAPSATPSAPPSATPSPTGSQLSSRERQMIENLLSTHEQLFTDAVTLQEELARGDEARSQVLYELLAQPLRHATTASQLGRPVTIGDLGFLLGESYTEIKDAATIGRSTFSANRPRQVESAQRTIQAIDALRPLNDQLRAVIGLGPRPS
jgi:hypothetical protein